MWSITQPLFGACSNGWFKQEHEPATRARARARSRRSAGSWSGMCSNTRQATTASKLPSGNGNALRRLARVDGTARARWRDARAARRVGSTPTTSRRRDRDGQPGDLAFTACRRRARAARPRGTPRSSGRICSSYSGSAPSVNPSCHHCAFCSQSRRERRSSSDRVGSAVDAEQGREEPAGVALGHLRDLLGRAFGDDRAAARRRLRVRGR